MFGSVALVAQTRLRSLVIIQINVESRLEVLHAVLREKIINVLSS